MKHPGSRRLSIRRNIIWSFWGNAIYAACQWGMIVVLAKLGNSSAVGQFNLALAVTAPVILLGNLQLRAVQATDAGGEFSFSDYLSLRVQTTALSLIVIALISFIADWPLETRLVVLAIGLAKGCESISDILWGALQKQERLDRIAISMIARGVLSLLALGSTFVVTGSVSWAAVALALSWGCILLVVDVPAARNLVGFPEGKLIRLAVDPQARSIQRALVKRTMPLGVVTGLESLGFNVPRYLIEYQLGTGPLGIFSAIAYAQTAVLVGVRAIGQSVSPRLAVYWNEQNIPAFRSLLTKLVLSAVVLGAVGVVLAAVLGREVLAVLYTGEYSLYNSVFVLSMAGALFAMVGSAFLQGTMAKRHFNIQVVVYGIPLVVSAVCCVLLVPTAGLEGAALSVVIASVVHALLAAASLRSTVR